MINDGAMERFVFEELFSFENFLPTAYCQLPTLSFERWNDGAWFQILGFLYLHKAFIDCKLEMS